MANRTSPDQIPHSVTSDLGRHFHFGLSVRINRVNKVPELLSMMFVKYHNCSPHKAFLFHNERFRSKFRSPKHCQCKENAPIFNYKTKHNMKKAEHD